MLLRHRQLARVVLPLARGSTVPRSSLNNVPLYLRNMRTFSSLPDHEVVGLPALSPTMEAGTIGTWHVGPGDSFEAGEVIAEIETDKATMGFEAQDPGVVAKILVETGSEVKVGSPIMVIVDDTDDAAALVSSFANFTVDAAPAPAPVVPTETPAPTPTAPTSAAPAVAPAASPASGDRVFASPLARKTARALGYDINLITATGPRGRVVAADVNNYVPGTATATAGSTTTSSTAATTSETPSSASASSSTVAPIQTGDYVDYAVSEQAREIAARMTKAKQEVPHYYLTVDIELKSLLETRDKLNAVMAQEEQISVNDMFIKAAGLAMKTVPAVNSSWMESVVRTFKRCDINVIVGAGDSAQAPVLYDVGSKGLKSISDDMRNTMQSLETADGAVPYTAGTFSMVNLGMYGVTSAAPIVTSPQAAVLAMGAIEDRVLPNEDPESEVIYRIAPVVTATCSFDHRVVDGAVGAQWLDAFKKLIENPMTMLL